MALPTEAECLRAELDAVKTQLSESEEVLRETTTELTEQIDGRDAAHKIIDGLRVELDAANHEKDALGETIVLLEAESAELQARLNKFEDARRCAQLFSDKMVRWSVPAKLILYRMPPKPEAARTEPKGPTNAEVHDKT